MSIWDIAYNNNREISEITVVNQNGIKVFEMKVKKVRKKQEDFRLTVEQTSELTNEMNRVTLEKAMRSLKKTVKKVDEEAA